jgi:hypothetical protein
MPNKFLKLSLVLVLSLIFVSTSIAQRQTGSILGRVTDNEGVALPGASVTLLGPSLMGKLTYTTTENGDFRFPAVPPGQGYVITVSLDGFKTVNQAGIIVHVGKTVKLNIKLETAILSEELTVTASAPIIDVTSSKMSVNYTEDQLRDMPVARDYSQILFSAPGVIEEPNYSIYRTFVSHGATVRSNEIAVDGVGISDPALKISAIGISYDVFEEFEFELGAHPAEIGRVEGAYVNIVTKSGGNEFHGGANAYFFNKSMVEALIPDEEAEAVGLSKPTGFKNMSDFSLSLGGPILKDKLWFFVNGRYIDWTKQWETLPNGLFDLPHNEFNSFAKLTFQLSPNVKLAGMWSFTYTKEPYHSYYLYGSSSYYKNKSVLYKVDGDKTNIAFGQISWIVDQNTFFDLRMNISSNLWNWLSQDLASPYYYDLFTRVTSGTMPSVNLLTKRTSFILSATRFLSNFLGASHELKAGFQFEISSDYSKSWHDSAYIIYTYNGQPWGLANVVPFMGLFSAVVVGADKEAMPLKDKERRFGIYLQDSITIKNRLTLNLGVRYDEDHGDILGGTYRPAGTDDPVLTMLNPSWYTTITLSDEKDVIAYKFLSPRIGAVFDVFGDGKTSLKASWSLYSEFLLGWDLRVLNPGYLDASMMTSYWFDLNKNGIIESTDGFAPTVLPVAPQDYVVSDFVDPELKTPYSSEIIVGIERELLKDFSFGVSFIYKKKYNVIDNTQKLRGYTSDSGWWVPYTTTDPGWDGVFETSDDSQVTIYGLKVGAPPSRRWWTNPEGAERKYQAFEFVFNKRMSHRWQLLGSLTLSKYQGNINAGFLNTTHYYSEFDTPNWYVNRYGRLDFDRPLLIKLQGAVQLPYGFNLSAFYSYSSGTPWARTISVQLPMDPELDISSRGQFVTVNAETPGKRRFQSRNNLDVRVEKYFEIANFSKLGIFLDVTNVLGENFFEINQDPGGYLYNNGSFIRWPTYGKVVSTIGLRTFKLSARFTF